MRLRFPSTSKMTPERGDALFERIELRFEFLVHAFSTLKVNIKNLPPPDPLLRKEGERYVRYSLPLLRKEKEKHPSDLHPLFAKRRAKYLSGFTPPP